LEASKAARYTHLGTRSEEELVRIHAIGDCTSNERNPVKDNRWFLSVVEDELVDHIENNRHQNKSGGIVCDAHDLACYQWNGIHDCRFDMKQK
jgi:hypothetical protein